MNFEIKIERSKGYEKRCTSVSGFNNIWKIKKIETKFYGRSKIGNLMLPKPEVTKDIKDEN